MQNGPIEAHWESRWVLQIGNQLIPNTCYPPPNSLTWDMMFLGKSYIEWNKVEKPTTVPISYEGSDDKEIEMVSGNKKIIVITAMKLVIPNTMTK